jgi:hypothetical protein
MTDDQTLLDGAFDRRAVERAVRRIPTPDDPRAFTRVLDRAEDELRNLEHAKEGTK